ncbi:hypothetical protein E2P81_ATG07288 [Venturia nashicola]|uniref:DUF7918 domain-containing protein n=1 Tax=Venturia nashicola TaxID=86259 RepID=A0A4Z1PEU9_9PEZI|nr:hypothetical protein E6O75_ATG07448 [Venturia nashicola]TLD31798.1 hypothetical protein E2P81_ATG07288 [Venturia nashicola]
MCMMVLVEGDPLIDFALSLRSGLGNMVIWTEWTSIEGTSKMLHPDGLEVYVESLDRNEPYAEYVKPGNSEVAGSKSVERYIEVIPGERFSVVFKISGRFHCRGQPKVSCSLTIDNGAVNIARILSTDELLKKQKLNTIFRTSKQWVGGKWVEAGYSFAELDLDEDLFHHDSLLSSLERKVGLIKVNVSLGHLDMLPKPRLQPRSEYTSSTSKQLYKNVGITTGMRPVLENAKEVAQPSGTRKFHRRFPSCDYNFVFFYRSSMTLDRLGIKLLSPIAQPAVVDLDSISEDLELTSSIQTGSSDIEVDSGAPEELELDTSVEHGQPDTAADFQAKTDGRTKAEAIEKTLSAAARQRTTFSLESYKDRDIEFFEAGLGLQLTPTSQNTMFSPSSVTNSQLVSMAIDTRRFRHIQWSPYECSLIRLSGVQTNSTASLTRDLKFTTRQEAELFMVRMMQMTAPIFIARTSERMTKLFANFPIERMPVCGGPEPNKLLSQRLAMPTMAEKTRLPLPTPPAPPTSRNSTNTPPAPCKNAPVSSCAPQAEKRKALEETVTNDEEGESSETPGRMSKKARSEPAAAAPGAVVSPESPELSTTPINQSEEPTVTRSNTATIDTTPRTPLSGTSATPVAQSEEATVFQSEAPEIPAASQPQNDVVDLTADDDDTPVKIEPSEARAMPRRDNGKRRAVTTESRAALEDDEEMSKEDINDEIELLDMQSREFEIQRREVEIQRRKIELRAKLRRRQRG